MSEVVQYSFDGDVLKLTGQEVPILFFVDKPDDPWFRAKQVHDFLGCATITQTLARVHDDDKAALKDLVAQKGAPINTVGRERPNHEDHNSGRSIYINESGLYTVISGSRKPVARTFQRWVTSKVLPSIRRTGHYGTTPGLTLDDVKAVISTLAASLFPAIAEQARAVASTVAANYTVYEATRSSCSNRDAEAWLKLAGRDAAADRELFEEAGPLDLASYIEERLPPEQHYVINHFKVMFAKEAKRRRIDFYEKTGDRFWVRYSQAQYRITYVEADRDMLDAIWGAPETQQYLATKLTQYMPVNDIVKSYRDTERRSARRPGPYSRPAAGGSQNVTQESVRAFFAPRSG